MNSKLSKHIVELFSAECRLCKTNADILKEKLKEVPGIDFIVHKASECVDGKCCQLAASYGIFAVPSIVIDGKLAKVGVIKDFEEISSFFK